MVHFDTNGIDLSNLDVIINNKCQFSISFSRMDHNLPVNMKDIVICRYEYLVTFEIKKVNMNAPHQYCVSASILI